MTVYNISPILYSSDTGHADESHILSPGGTAGSQVHPVQICTNKKFTALS